MDDERASGSDVDVPDSQVEAKARTSHVFAEIARSYGTGLDFFGSFGRDLIEAAALRPKERVLDLACGRGACLLPASAAVGADGFVLGIDLSPAMVELTSEELRRAAIENVEVRVGDAEHLDVPDGSFDAVTCGFGVFLFPATDIALRECWRVLRHGGRFAASTFADGMLDYPWLPEILHEMGWMGAAPTPRGDGMSLPLLRADELSRILSECSFSAVATTTTARRFVFADLDAFLLWVRSHAFGLFLRQLDADGLQRFEEKCAQRLERHRAADGYELVKEVELTVAHRP